MVILSEERLAYVCTKLLVFATLMLCVGYSCGGKVAETACRPQLCCTFCIFSYADMCNVVITFTYCATQVLFKSGDALLAVQQVGQLLDRSVQCCSCVFGRSRHFLETSIISPGGAQFHQWSGRTICGVVGRRRQQEVSYGRAWRRSTTRIRRHVNGWRHQLVGDTGNPIY